MKKKKNIKNLNVIKEENIINEEPEENNDIVQPIGSYHDFLIMEKKDKIKVPILELANLESDNLFFKDFLILQHRPNQQTSRFTQFFKEMSEKEKEKEKEDDKDKEKENEIKIENNNIDNNLIPNQNFTNMRYRSFDLNQNNFYFNAPHQNLILKNNLINTNNNANNQIGEYENKFYKNNKLIGFSSFSNPNSRTQSEIFNHGNEAPYSGRSTNSNTFNKTFSSNSVESNNNIIINNNLINNFAGGGTINFKHNNYIEKDFFEPNVDIKKVLTLEDKRTTIMIKNIPNKFTRDKLIELIDKNFYGTYDLFILPKDGNKNRNFGYSFINFTSSYFIPYFYHHFNGRKWTDTNSQKVCEITYSKIQGRNELISHYPNKIIFFSDVKDLNMGNKFFIPNEYKNLFLQLFPKQQIEENNQGFITKIPLY